MSDTQWPRFVVFHQSKVDEPHMYAGSVHAPDAEMALMNARDVFVRRPECVSLWVVRADRVFAKTAEELTLDSTWLADLPNLDAPIERYCVFKKIGHRGTSQHVGEVEASSPQHALRAALIQYPEPIPAVWWVCPYRAMTLSEPEDIEILFAQAWDKAHFRDQAEFHTVTQMKHIKAKGQQEEADD